MGPQSIVCFRLGKDYHLGDLLWLTAVIAEYRRQRRPGRVVVECPDLPINRILERSPVVDDVCYWGERSESDGVNYDIYDLRPLALARAMVRDWQYRRPWLYYRDLWLEPRGQWLATFLRLGCMREFRPVLSLEAGDLGAADLLPRPYVLLAPHIGRYSLPLASRFWQHLKGWPWESWTELARRLTEAGYRPATLGAAGDCCIPGTHPLLGIPIISVAGVVDQAVGLITGESGLWFLAAALRSPFMIVPWWLPHPVNWPAAVGVPHQLIYRKEATVSHVFDRFTSLTDDTRERVRPAVWSQARR